MTIARTIKARANISCIVKLRIIEEVLAAERLEAASSLFTYQYAGKNLPAAITPSARNCHQRLQGRSDRQYLHHHCPRKCPGDPRHCQDAPRLRQSRLLLSPLPVGHRPLLPEQNDDDGPLCGAVHGLCHPAGMRPQPNRKGLCHHLQCGRQLSDPIPRHLQRYPVQRVQDADHHPKPGQPLSQHRRLHPPVRHDQSQ